MAEPKVDIKELVNDVMAGMSVHELMEKHDLEWTQLERVYHQLNQRESIVLMSITRRKLLTESQFFRAFRQVQEAIEEHD